MRELLGEKPAEPPAPPVPPKAAVAVPHTDVSVWHAAAHLLEGVSALLAADPGGRPPVPADVRERLRAAVSALAASLGEASRGTQGPASLKSG